MSKRQRHDQVERSADHAHVEAVSQGLGKVQAGQSLRRRLTLSTVLVSVVPLVLAGGLSLAVAAAVGERELSELAEQRIIALRDSKKEQVEGYFSAIQDQLRTLSNDHMVIDAMRGLEQAFASYGTELKTSKQDEEAKREALGEYYERAFGAEYGRRNRGASAPVRRLLGKLDSSAVLLQSAYIGENPNPLGSKHELNAADDGTRYSTLHRKYHPKLRDFLEKFGYYDIFLVDLASGHVVYSVFKELDFATSLRDGAYANTGLAQAFVRAAEADTADVVAMTDFAPYAPSYEDQAAFVASPIFDGNEKVGVLVFQMPIDRINQLMTYGGQWEERGLGRSGETYLAGPDKRLRSMSRGLSENPEAHLRSLQAGGVDLKTVERISTKGSSIGIEPVSTEGYRLARQHESGVLRYADHRGVELIGAYAPLAIEGLDWVILSQVEQQEAMAANGRLRSALASSTAAVMAVFVLCAVFVGVWLARRITAPILTLQATVAAMEASSDLSLRAPVGTADEIGAAALAFNRLAERMQSTIADLDSVTSGLARGELFVKLNEGYEGDFGRIKESVERALASLNEVLREADQVAQQVNLSAAKLKDTSQRVAAAAHEQSSAAHEALSAVDQAASMAEANASNAQSVSKLVGVAVRAAGESQKRMVDMEQSMADINEAAKRIVKVVGVIDEISFKTNLLSINATVEAARAGKYGRGFAAVAQEVRSLAERSAKAAKETGAIIEETSQKVRHGVEVASATAGSLSGIADNVDEVGSLISEITSATKEQAIGLNEVRTAMQQVNGASQSALEQSARLAVASDELSHLTKTLKSELGRFQLDEEAPQATSREQRFESGPAMPTKLQQVEPRALNENRDHSAASLGAVAANHNRKPTGVEEEAELSPAQILPLDEDERGYGTF